MIQGQNPLKDVLADMERDLELNQNFFLGDNVDREKIIPKKGMRKNRNSKNYSPTKVKAQNFLTNISYNRLKSPDFDNASFIIDCYTYSLFNLNPFFLEQKFDGKNDRDYVLTIWNYLILSKLYIYICRHDNFIELNKLSLKYQNAFDILNALMFQYIYSSLFPKYFCRVDDYGAKNRFAFEVADAAYQKQQNTIV